MQHVVPTVNEKWKKISSLSHLIVEYFMAHADFVLLSIIYFRLIYFQELCLFA